MRVLVLLAACWCPPTMAERWKWPHQRSVKIDNKVRFVDSLDSPVFDKDRYLHSGSNVQADEVPQEGYEPTSDTADVPPQPARGEDAHRTTHTQPYGQFVNYRDRRPQSEEWISNYDNDGSLSSGRLCKCTSQQHCALLADIPNPCAAGELCCYNTQRKQNQQHTEYFNEIDDERPLYIGPGTPVGHSGPFPPRNYPHNNGLFGLSPGHESSLMGPLHERQQSHRPGPGPAPGDDGPTGLAKPSILVGPEGPTGIIGPASVIKKGHYGHNAPKGVLVGPGAADDGAGLLTGSSGPAGVLGLDGPDVSVGSHGATGNIGPSQLVQQPDVLVGPGGPTGLIGPNKTGNRPGVLIGPGGPTGVIGPNRPNNRPAVLVGPGGPTGVIGPNRPNNRPAVLVGPGGPTGIIGPNRPNNSPAVLVGPGGPTGIIGPNRPNNNRPAVLVGPGGPTGIIGPNRPNNNRPAVLVGPGGPTGIIGPNRPNNNRPAVLVGPGGPTGIIGPNRPNNNRPAVLVGPGGPTGIIGPNGPNNNRPAVLVGFGGPTGIIGRGGYDRRPGVFVSADDPTAHIGNK